MARPTSGLFKKGAVRSPSTPPRATQPKMANVASGSDSKPHDSLSRATPGGPMLEPAALATPPASPGSPSGRPSTTANPRFLPGKTQPGLDSAPSPANTGLRNGAKLRNPPFRRSGAATDLQRATAIQSLYDADTESDDSPAERAPLVRCRRRRSPHWEVCSDSDELAGGPLMPWRGSARSGFWDRDSGADGGESSCSSPGSPGDVDGGPTSSGSRRGDELGNEAHRRATQAYCYKRTAAEAVENEEDSNSLEEMRRKRRKRTMTDNGGVGTPHSILDSEADIRMG